MKAKVKSLGSVVDLSEYVYDEDGNEYTWDEVELIDDDKWQHYHIQAAIAALNGITSSGSFEQHTLEDVIAECMTLADALIAELKKGEKDGN